MGGDHDGAGAKAVGIVSGGSVAVQALPQDQPAAQDRKGSGKGSRGVRLQKVPRSTVECLCLFHYVRKYKHRFRININIITLLTFMDKMVCSSEVKSVWRIDYLNMSRGGREHYAQRGLYVERFKLDTCIVPRW